MRFLDRINKSLFKNADKIRLEYCPYPKSCLPTSYDVGHNKAGVCCGIIHNSPNLDCVRICQFIHKKGKLLVDEHFLTPLEALNVARCLMTAIETSFDCNTAYEKHRLALNKARRNADMRPAVDKISIRNKSKENK